ncbi:MAG: single-stranded DNA-binding protein [Candidimonas sp.]|nr:MAG: single-stranded DNA-binding protein [Candidimonas sp.]TAM24787.1 MAG: single-stranded DNA-binding protein [Candidimonas sp.]
MNEVIEFDQTDTRVATRPQSVAAEAQSDSSALLSVIERIALNPDVDITKLEKMLDMQERIFNRNAEQAFNAAMAIAQSEMGPVSTDAENPQTKSKYASYAAIDRAIRPIYTKHGFALSYDTEDGAPEGHIRVVCLVSHRDGHCRKYKADMPADGLGAKGGAVMTKTHAAGSAMSYGQRYLLKLIFNVAIGEGDDDGNGAMIAKYADIIDDWVAAAEAAADIEELDQIWKDGLKELSKTDSLQIYERFKSAVSVSKKRLEGMS